MRAASRSCSSAPWRVPSPESPADTPIEGAAIALVGGTATASSNAAGSFSLMDLPSTYSVRIVAGGWAPRTIPRGDDCRRPDHQPRHHPAQPGRHRDRHGRVRRSTRPRWPASRSPRPRAATPCRPTRTGVFTLQHQPEGSVTLAFAKTGWDSRGAGPFTATINGTTDTGQIQLVPKGIVTGLVVDVTTGTPVEGVTRHAHRNDRQHPPPTAWAGSRSPTPAGTTP